MSEQFDKVTYSYLSQEELNKELEGGMRQLFNQLQEYKDRCAQSGVKYDPNDYAYAMGILSPPQKDRLSPRRESRRKHNRKVKRG